MNENLFYLFLIGLMAGVVLTALYLIFWQGERQSRKKFDCLYSTIDFYLNYGIKSQEGYKFIKAKFEEMSELPYCNREKAQVLENEFYKKYSEYNGTE